VLLAALVASTLAVLPAHGADPGPYPDCAGPSATPTLAVGQVACQVLPSADLGAPTAFSYFVPPGCVRRRCPTLYLLHGFGGDYHGMLGTAARPSSWAVSLSKGPPVDPHSVPDPWNYSDTSKWVAKPAID